MPAAIIGPATEGAEVGPAPDGMLLGPETAASLDLEVTVTITAPPTAICFELVD